MKNKTKANHRGSWNATGFCSLQSRLQFRKKGYHNLLFLGMDRWANHVRRFVNRPCGGTVTPTFDIYPAGHLSSNVTPHLLWVVPSDERATRILNTMNFMDSVVPQEESRRRNQLNRVALRDGDGLIASWGKVPMMDLSIKKHRQSWCCSLWIALIPQPILTSQNKRESPTIATATSSLHQSLLSWRLYSLE